MTVSSILRRLRRVLVFARLRVNPIEVAKLAVLGLARDNPFGGKGLVGKVLGGLFRTVTVRPALLRGHAVSIDSHDLGQLVSFEEIFVEQVYDLARVPFAPQVVLDCGAHVGLFSVLAGAAYPTAKLIAYEPNPENLPWLGRNLLPLGARVSFKEAAASTYAGRRRFVSEFSNTGHLQDGTGDGVEVNVLDFADELKAVHGQALLLKMDIEGEEERLLPHIVCVLPQECALFLETHHGPEKRAQTETFLEEHGFRTSVLRERADFADLLALRYQG